MSKKGLSKTAIFIILLSAAIAAHAQTKFENSSGGTLNEPLKIKSDFSISPNTKIEPKNVFKRKFKDTTATEKESAGKTSGQTQTYVRPTKEERRKRYLSDAFGVFALIGSAFGATINQIGNDPPEWRKTAGGFGKRFASAYGTNAIRNTISYGLSETFKLDNRSEKSEQKNFGKRLKHAFLGSYMTRTKTGKRIPDFPFVTGTYTAAVIANEVWYPNRYSYQDGFRDGTISLGVRFGVNLLREFIFPK